MSNRTVAQAKAATRPPQSDLKAVEWPTIGLIIVVYVAFAALTWYHAALPIWLLVPLGGYITALHGSLQHEAIHGHPTRSPRLNHLLVWPSLWLWMPYGRYRETHLSHHRDAKLTDPVEDPESYYVTDWSLRRSPLIWRAILRVNATLAGRLTIGPLVAVFRLVAGDLPKLVRGDPGTWRAWLEHLAGVGLVVLWVAEVAGMPLWLYIAAFAYPGLSLTLLRSYAEHRAAMAPEARTAIVETGPVMSLLFLNNNLHTVHHTDPGLAWYRIPARYRENRRAWRRRNGDYVIRGYRTLFRHYLFRAKEPLVHPTIQRP